ncbi:MAG TPA: TlyA family rRNA (cytidine-2'-O)-methyltransferase [Actinobacteria bacterium]|nr:TlyA family rRNA (cytidine-2'-O)-methyltransferase [Actinomycetota bacterium]
MKKGLASSKKEALAFIMEGRIKTGNRLILKPGDTLPVDSKIELIPGKPYVSRGGYKLEGVFNDLGLSAKNKTAIDIGSSTGGFTDYLLLNGAKIVTAVDVGYGLLSWKLRNCDKVEVLERTNIRYLNRSRLKYFADLAVADVSFISIKKILSKILEITAPGAGILLLIKPQFELRKEDVKNKGIVKEKQLHIKALTDIVKFLENFPVSVNDIVFSRIKGARGNIEFWIYLKKSKNSTKSKLNYDKIIDDIVNKAHLFFS